MPLTWSRLGEPNESVIRDRAGRCAENRVGTVNAGPNLVFRKTFRVRAGELDAGGARFTCFSPVTGRGRAHRMTVAVRQLFAVHLQGEQRGQFERFPDGIVCGEIIDP